MKISDLKKIIFTSMVIALQLNAPNNNNQPQWKASGKNAGIPDVTDSYKYAPKHTKISSKQAAAAADRLSTPKEIGDSSPRRANRTVRTGAEATKFSPNSHQSKEQSFVTRSNSDGLSHSYTPYDEDGISVSESSSDADSDAVIEDVTYEIENSKNSGSPITYTAQSTPQTNSTPNAISLSSSDYRIPSSRSDNVSSNVVPSTPLQAAQDRYRVNPAPSRSGSVNSNNNTSTSLNAIDEYRRTPAPSRSGSVASNNNIPTTPASGAYGGSLTPLQAAQDRYRVNPAPSRSGSVASNNNIPTTPASGAYGGSLTPLQAAQDRYRVNPAPSRSGSVASNNTPASGAHGGSVTPLQAAQDRYRVTPAPSRSGSVGSNNNTPASGAHGGSITPLQAAQDRYRVSPAPSRSGSTASNNNTPASGAHGGSITPLQAAQDRYRVNPTPSRSGSTASQKNIPPTPFLRAHGGAPNNPPLSKAALERHKAATSSNGSSSSSPQRRSSVPQTPKPRTQRSSVSSRSGYPVPASEPLRTSRRGSIRPVRSGNVDPLQRGSNTGDPAQDTRNRQNNQNDQNNAEQRLPFDNREEAHVKDPNIFPRTAIPGGDSESGGTEGGSLNNVSSGSSSLAKKTKKTSKGLLIGVGLTALICVGGTIAYILSAENCEDLYS